MPFTWGKSSFGTLAAFEDAGKFGALQGGGVLTGDATGGVSTPDSGTLTGGGALAAVGTGIALLISGATFAGLNTSAAIGSLVGGAQFGAASSDSGSLVGGASLAGSGVIIYPGGDLIGGALLNSGPSSDIGTLVAGGTLTATVFQHGDLVGGALLGSGTATTNTGSLIGGAIIICAVADSGDILAGGVLAGAPCGIGNLAGGAVLAGGMDLLEGGAVMTATGTAVIANSGALIVGAILHAMPDQRCSATGNRSRGATMSVLALIPTPAPGVRRRSGTAKPKPHPIGARIRSGAALPILARPPTAAGTRTRGGFCVGVATWRR